jgi:hypothetical protein
MAQCVRSPGANVQPRPPAVARASGARLPRSTRAPDAMPDPARPLRIGDLVEVILTGEVRRILEVNPGTLMLYRACGLPAAEKHVHGRGKFDPVTDPCEWYLAEELMLLS